MSKHNQKSAGQLMADNMEQALNLLVDSCKKQAKQFNSESIPISYLETAKNIIVQNYREGLEEEVPAKKSIKDRLKGTGKK